MSEHYKFEFRGAKLDPYRICKIYGIIEPAQQHAIKKLLRAGRSVKPLVKDIEETIESLQRWKEMIEEDGPTVDPTQEVPCRNLQDILEAKCSKCGKTQPPMSLGDPCWTCACKKMIAGIQPTERQFERYRCMGCNHAFIPRPGQTESDIGDWKLEDGRWFHHHPKKENGLHDVFEARFDPLIPGK